MRVSAVGKSIRIAYIIPYESYYGTTYGSSMVLLVIAFAFFLVLTVWILAAKGVMSRKAVTQTQRRHYGARRLRVTAASLGAVGFVVILLTGMFGQALSDIYYSTTTCQSALDTLYSMTEENSIHEARLTEQRSEQYLSYAMRIAALLGLYPDLKTVDQLAAMSETIGADYLILLFKPVVPCVEKTIRRTHEKHLLCRLHPRRTRGCGAVSPHHHPHQTVRRRAHGACGRYPSSGKRGG